MVPDTTQSHHNPSLNSVAQNLIRLEYITKEWYEKLVPAFQIFAKTLLRTLSTTDFFPEGVNIFRAFKECSYENTKVVLIGQDPYHDGSATGLCFDNVYGTFKGLSPSLKNIIKELSTDIGVSGEEGNTSW